jgi:hypothetical protein
MAVLVLVQRRSDRSKAPNAAAPQAERQSRPALVLVVRSERRRRLRGDIYFHGKEASARGWAGLSVFVRSGSVLAQSRTRSQSQD